MKSLFNLLIFCGIYSKWGIAVSQTENFGDSLLLSSLEALNRTLIYEAAHTDELSSQAILNLKQVADQLQQSVDLAEKQNAPKVVQDKLKQMMNLARNLSTGGKLPMHVNRSKLPMEEKRSKLPKEENKNKLPTEENRSKLPTEEKRNKLPTEEKKSKLPSSSFIPTPPTLKSINQTGKGNASKSGIPLTQPLEDVDCNETPSFIVGDDCYSEIEAIGGTGLCNLTEKCKVFILNGTERDTFNGTDSVSLFNGTVSRLELLQDVEILGCTDADYHFVTDGSDMNTLKNSLCSEAYYYSQLLATLNYPAESRDLFLAAIATCGAYGYAEFLEEEWISEILNWQETNGGYSPSSKCKGEQSKSVQKRSYPSNDSNDKSSALSTSVAAKALSSHVHSNLMTKDSSMSSSNETTPAPTTTTVPPTDTTVPPETTTVPPETTTVPRTTTAQPSSAATPAKVSSDPFATANLVSFTFISAILFREFVAKAGY